jgi:plasmid replication initiation protein
VFPTREEEYMFAFTFFNQGDIRDQSDRSYFGENVFPYVGPIQDNSFLYGNEYVSRNMTYRWRFLNAHFDTTYLNVSFAVFY